MKHTNLQNSKNLAMTLLLGVLLTAPAFAEVDDFHSLINDSIAAKDDLSKKLHNSVQDVAREKQAPKVAIDESSQEQSEDVVVPSRGVVMKANRDIGKNDMRKISKETNSRVSEEINDAQ